MSESQPETIAVPPRVRELFERLARSRSNRILSLNGPEDDRALFQLVEQDPEPYRAYLAPLGLHLAGGENHFYLTGDDAAPTKVSKLVALVELVQTLCFFKRHIDDFGEGAVFSELDLAGKCDCDEESERFLLAGKKSGNLRDSLAAKIRELEDKGFFQLVDEERSKYRVLSAINYLEEIADKIRVPELEAEEEEAGEGA
jgi:hypothetical protein